MKPFVFLLAFSAFSSWAADPTATIAGISQNPNTGSITVTYSLGGADAIVTLGGAVAAAEDDWTDLPDSAFRSVVGDVNKAVPVGSSKTIVWSPEPSVLYGAKHGIRVRLTLWSPSAPPDYLSAEIDGAKELRYYTSPDALPFPLTDNYWKLGRMLFRKIPAKGVVWNMASISSSRLVRLTSDYYIGVFQHTKGQSSGVQGIATNRLDVVEGGSNIELIPEFGFSYNGCRGADPDDQTAVYPLAEGSYIKKLNGKVALTLDLPTEAEWEYACRAGCGGALYSGEPATSDNLEKLAWCEYNGRKVHEVALKRPNAWGLYDMLGNVAEWCLDYYAKSDNAYFSTTEVVDNPVGPASAQEKQENRACRVMRGGSYMSGSSLLDGANLRARSYYTRSDDPSFGIRLRASVPGALSAKIVQGTSRRQSLDNTVKNGYWDCTAYENPAVIEVEEDFTGDFRQGTFAASQQVAPDGVFDSIVWNEDASFGVNLSSRPPSGISIIVR